MQKIVVPIINVAWLFQQFLTTFVPTGWGNVLTLYSV